MHRPDHARDVYFPPRQALRREEASNITMYASTRLVSAAIKHAHTNCVPEVHFGSIASYTSTSQDQWRGRLTALT